MCDFSPASVGSLVGTAEILSPELVACAPCPRSERNGESTGERSGDSHGDDGTRHHTDSRAFRPRQ